MARKSHDGTKWTNFTQSYKCKTKQLNKPLQSPFNFEADEVKKLHTMILKVIWSKVKNCTNQSKPENNRGFNIPDSDNTYQMSQKYMSNLNNCVYFINCPLYNFCVISGVYNLKLLWHDIETGLPVQYWGIFSFVSWVCSFFQVLHFTCFWDYLPESCIISELCGRPTFTIISGVMYYLGIVW